jgi:hypothetical protein
MLLFQFLFHVQIIEMENRLSRVENELKTMKEEVVATKKDEVWKEDQAKMLKETTKDMVARWWKDGGQGCSKDAPPKM